MNALVEIAEDPVAVRRDPGFIGEAVADQVVTVKMRPQDLHHAGKILRKGKGFGTAGHGAGNERFGFEIALGMKTNPGKAQIGAAGVNDQNGLVCGKGAVGRQVGGKHGQGRSAVSKAALHLSAEQGGLALEVDQIRMHAGLQQEFFRFGGTRIIVHDGPFFAGRQAQTM